MQQERVLIVNADDFGLSEGVNEGIIKAYDEGIVTSASLMVRFPAAQTAVEYSATRPDLSLGLHIDLGEWFLRDDEWQQLYRVVDDLEDPSVVRKELSRQLEMFEDLAGRRPTHLDSHQHVHQNEPLRSLAGQMSERLGIPLRHFSAHLRYEGSFYGQDSQGKPHPAGISVEGLCALLRELPGGVTELGCHPGYSTGLETMYRDERIHEIEALCHPDVRHTLEREHIRLSSMASIAASDRAS